MTDFDYEILEAVAQHQEGIEQSALEDQYITNSAYLEAKQKSIEGFSTAFTFNYTITDRGKSMLANWQRRRAEKAKELKHREILKMMGSIFTGVITGVVATLICSKFLGI